MMGVAVGATSFSDLVAEAVALGADPHEELLRHDGWHGFVRDADGKLVAYLFGCESRDEAMKFAFDQRRSTRDCHAWVMHVVGGQLESVEEVLAGY